MRFLARILLLAGLLTATPSAGCRSVAPMEHRAITAGVLPYVVAPVGQMLGSGWGVEVAIDAFNTNMGFIAPEASFRTRLAWSHHEAGSDRPGAEYIRFAAEVASAYWFAFGGAAKSDEKADEEGDEKADLGLAFYAGPLLYWVLVDGPGDTLGLGVSLGTEIRFRAGESACFLAGLSVELWPERPNNSVVLSPYVRLGLEF